jgi:myo-inositol 2-dehydrogenase/D-chiro-inositol 1-dehydrogenase
MATTNGKVFGSAGSIQTDNNYPNNTTLSTASAVQRDLPLNFFMHRYIEAYAAEIEAFVAAITTDTPVRASGDDARKASIAGLAAWQSYRTGRPVKLAEISANGE